MGLSLIYKRESGEHRLTAQTTQALNHGLQIELVKFPLAAAMHRKTR